MTTPSLSTLQSQLDAQEATLKESTRQLAALREELDRRAAEPAPKPEVVPIKVDDLVVRTMNGDTIANRVTLGKVYRVHAISDNGSLTITADDRGIEDFGYSPGYFRHADFTSDRASVEAFILGEAARKGFKVGAHVRRKPDLDAHPIESMGVAWDVNQSGLSFAVFDGLREAAGQPIAYATYAGKSPGGSSRAPVSQLTLVADEPITIEVAGQTYTADFTQPGGLAAVTFGCARITHSDLRAAHQFLLSRVHPPGATDSNRNVTGVQIGKGLFSLDLLTRIVARLDASSS